MNQMLTKDHEYGIHLLASSTTRYYLVAPIKGKNNYELFVLIPDDKTINLPTDYTIIKEHYIDDNKFVSVAFDTETSTLHFDKLDASEFRVYELKRA